MHQLFIQLMQEKNDSNFQKRWMAKSTRRTDRLSWMVFEENFSGDKPKKILKGKDYDESFNIFKERVLEMSKSIKEAISIDTFVDVEHLGGAAAAVIADDDWFKGRRHANQAFQVYEMWKNQNQSPSFLSFRNKKRRAIYNSLWAT